MKLYFLQYKTNFFTLEFADIVLQQQKNRINSCLQLAQHNLLVKCLKLYSDSTDRHSEILPYNSINNPGP